MEESKCYTLNFIAFTCKSKDLKVPHQVNKNWHWTNIHKVMKHLRLGCRMSGGFQSVLISNPTTPVTSSNSCLNASSSDPSKVSERETILESHMLLKQENSPDVAVGSPGFIIEQSQSQATLRNIDADYNSNSFNFSYDGSFSLSPQQSVDMKDLEKSDATSVILSNQPLSNSLLVYWIKCQSKVLHGCRHQ
ncbi:zinc finger protein 541 [Trichonephila clavata]|uniref:Zinc finger protein 541 n=1 Tax=Trichonephila clavata TaxID=2740835 RepID=A0A8X6L6V8_TRICU|nr:zinc finger protein 541 [Trichonephila clavata]